MTTLTESPQRLAAQCRKSFRDQFPNSHRPLLNLARSIRHETRWGYFNAEKQCPVHRNASSLNGWRRWIRKLTVTTICRHFIASGKDDVPAKDEFVWFINACPRMSVDCGSIRFALIQFDIDDKGQHGDASNMLAHLQAEIPLLSGAYSEASTNGWGIHAYLPVSFSPQMNNQSIIDCLNILQERVKRISHHGQTVHAIESCCKEVRGRPSITNPSDPSTTLYAGELVKLPRPDSDDAALALVDICSDPIGWDRWAEWLNLSAPSTNEAKQEPGIYIHNDRGEIEPLKSSHMNSGDAFERTLLASSEFIRLHKRPPTGDELLSHYESQGHSTGPRNRRRIDRCNQVANVSAEQFDKSKISGDPLIYLSDIKRHITDLDIKAVWSSKVSTLQPEDIALVLYLIGQRASTDKPHAFSKNYFLIASRQLKKEKRISRCLDNKRIAAAKKLLTLKRYIEITRVGTKGHGASLIRLVAAI